jgi:hypothetical protein
MFSHIIASTDDNKFVYSSSYCDITDQGNGNFWYDQKTVD